ncbi:MAG: NUDIX hydrolase [Chloroflexi bacterium]|nr:NUDIX hydrolase [Chloroflexota bacterium]
MNTTSQTQKKTKHSVALAVRRDGMPETLLVVRRPLDDAELPGVWGLPAASLRDGEVAENAVRRIGAEKLGTELRMGGRLAHGRQVREGYVLEMNLYEAWTESGEIMMPGHILKSATTLYIDWKWGSPDDVSDGASKGSLCSQLLLDVASNDAGGMS